MSRSKLPRIVTRISGPAEGSTYKHGLGFLNSKKANMCLIERESANDRVIMALFGSKFQKVGIVQCRWRSN